MVSAADPRSEQTLKVVLRKRVERCGDKAWIVTPERGYTYREIDLASNCLGRCLMGLGIEMGQTVLIMVPDVIDYIQIWCALAKFGAIEVPVNVHYRGAILAHIINDSRADTMIVDRQYLDRVAVVAGELKGLKRLILYTEGAAGVKPERRGAARVATRARFLWTKPSASQAVPRGNRSRWESSQRGGRDRRRL